MSQTKEFIIVPRCVAWTQFQKSLQKIRSQFSGQRIVVVENNPGNFNNYAEDVEVIQFPEDRYSTENLERELKPRVDWSSCAHIIIPVNNYDIVGYDHFIEFTRAMAEIDSHLILPNQVLIAFADIDKHIDKRNKTRPINVWPLDKKEQEKLVKARQKEALEGTIPRELIVQIQTVSSCNARCVFCPYKESYNKKNPGVMDSELFLSIVEQLKKFKIYKLCLYLQNEPFVDESIFEKIEHVKKELNFNILEFSTNCSLLRPKRALKLAKAIQGISHEIWVSFHGINKDGHETIMGINHERTLNNVIEFAKIAEEYDLNVIIRGAGASKIPGEKAKSWHYTQEEHAEFWKEKFKEAGIKRSPILQYFMYHSRSGNIDLASKGEIIRPSLKDFYCYRIDRALHISYDGDVVICCNDYHREEVMGNLKKQTIEELYKSERYQLLRKQVLGLADSPDDFICKRCDFVGG